MTIESSMFSLDYHSFVRLIGYFYASNHPCGTILLLLSRNAIFYNQAHCDYLKCQCKFDFVDQLLFYTKFMTTINSSHFSQMRVYLRLVWQ